MPVTVINRPIGHKLNTSDISAIVLDSGGEALIYTGSAHGLQDGDYVYIESNFDSYNGFKYVDSVAYDAFKIRASENGDYAAFKQSADILFRVSTLDHGWQCVHLPIVYELETDIYPTNTVEDGYTPRVISFAADSNGYTGLAASTNFVNINSLDFIELVGDGPLAGVYQILRYIDPDEIVINLAWDASNVFTGYELRKYYNNYFISVNVYGGIPSGHTWEAEKPVELLATLKLTPDSNNRIKFSIAEVLKSQIELRNNLTLDTLPNNIDFWTSFYIGYFESFDTSDGEEITLYSSEEVVDNFTGYAMNAILPFKSLNAGHMSDYVPTEGRWLTIQDKPILIEGYFFDLSFINTVRSRDIKVNVNKMVAGGVMATEVITIENPGNGILRVPLTAEATYDEFCVYAYVDAYLPPIPALNLWTNKGSGTSWTLSSTPDITLSASDSSKYLAGSFAGIAGETYEFTFQFSINNANNDQTKFFLLDAALAIVDSITFTYGSSGTKTETFELTAATDISYVAMTARHTGLIGSPITWELLSASINSGGTPMQILTETICIDVIGDCASTFVDDNLRITEDDILRKLE